MFFGYDIQLCMLCHLHHRCVLLGSLVEDLRHGRLVELEAFDLGHQHQPLGLERHNDTIFRRL